MAKPYTIDAGGLFAKTKNLYRRLVASEEKAEDSARRARQMIAEAKTAPDLTEAQLGKIAEATTLLAGIDELLMQARDNRLRLLARTVNSMGSSLARVHALRSQLTLGEEGLKQFDKELSDITARYQNVYRPMFPVMEGGLVKIPDPEDMTEQAWERIQDNLEGPLFFWDYNACKELWPANSAPACSGPDYLYALSLVNQVFVAWEHELEIRRDFPIITMIDDGLFDGSLETQDEILGEIEEATENVTQILGDILAILAKVTGALRQTPGFVLLLGAGALFLLTRK